MRRELHLRTALAALGLAGLAIATYLAIVHYEGGQPACLAGGEGCSKVQNSDYAELAGVPVPVIGVGGYLSVLLAASLAGDVGRFLGLFAGLVGAGFSLYLTYLELFEIEAICQWCVASAVLMCLVLVVAAIRVLRFGGRRDSPRTTPTPTSRRAERNPMASRKQEKEDRKQARLEAEHAAAAEERRKRLLAGVGAAVLAAVVVVVALVVVSMSGDDGGGDAGSLSGVSEIEAEVGDLPQRGSLIGDRGAAVTVREFGDLQCPACAQFSESVIPDLLAGPVSAGDASLEFNNFVILGPDSETAARAALAASEQDRYWQFIELFYRNQGAENSGYVTDEFLTSVAEGASVPDLEAWGDSRGDPRWDQVLSDTQAEAVDFGLTGTPSIVVEGPGGAEVLGTPGSLGEIEDAIARVG